MTRKPVKFEVIQQGEERILLRVYDDGSEERVPIVRMPRKKRGTSRPYWYWELRTGRRKFF